MGDMEMTFKDVLNTFRNESFTEKGKGADFERLMQSWLRTDPRYAGLFTHVWLWEEFPARKDFGGNDTGIDLVAKTDLGDYWAIQCKCYSEATRIDKPDVDSFLATSGRVFLDEATLQTTGFARRLWIATTNHWGRNAEEAIQNQNPPVTRIGLSDLELSPVDWGKLLEGMKGSAALGAGKQLRPHQIEAISKAEAYYKDHDRGKLIMACGTGKTFTSLRLVEHLLAKQEGGEGGEGEGEARGLVLFLVPSIALLSQSINDWAADARKPIRAVCVCSDPRAQRRTRRGKTYLDEEDAEGGYTIVDLALPASTDSDKAARQLEAYRKHEGLVVVFSTYQSIEVVRKAQQQLLERTEGAYGVFDFIVCDEAHRTTGVKISTKDESAFIKIHDNGFIEGRRRLYMTATPVLYTENARAVASRKDYVLCSMDDKDIYGEEFHRVNFSYAVRNGILTDYKVLVLTVSESMLPENIRQDITDNDKKEINYDDTGRLVGVINGLSKNIVGDGGLTWSEDPRLMRRALAFTRKIGSKSEPGTSKNVEAVFPYISEKFNENLTDEERRHAVRIQTRHVDGSMGASERNEALAWLAEEPDDEQECRVVTNVRCLSEGVDVPALDAVLFLSPKNSQVDVVQSVGRVMRSFHKGKTDEKRYGYIIIPVVVPETVSPEEALEDNKTYAVVWQILNALRAHDDNFNAYINHINLNRNPGGSPGKEKIIVASGGIAHPGAKTEATTPGSIDLIQHLDLHFDNLKKDIYAKIVEKCGERLYWENWAGEVGVIARKYIERIARLVDSDENREDGGDESRGKYRREFSDFVRSLRANLNPSISSGEAIEMLAQHMITRPVFDALFSQYEFVKNNSISRSMQFMVDLMEQEAMGKDLETLRSFYSSVRKNIGNIDNLEGKQTVIKTLYEKFFKRAFPQTVEKLGTVYTPVECVDFIIRSIDDVLKREFNSALTRENVHILDPFVGTGTFITRLLQTGVIAPEDMKRKYTREIHCNEIVLLAYYIADVNIESVFQEQSPQTQYLPYNGICLTDTFQLAEQPDSQDLFREYFKENADEVERQKNTPIRVIIGNPPYSIGQRAANDNAQNQHYPKLEQRIAETYAARSTANTKKPLYDSYIKAFRWATDRLDPDEGGIVAFISNGAWLDGLAQDGMRATLVQEYDKIYVFNLRGNCRTSGELRRREGDGVFNSGSRTSIAITILVRKPKAERQPCQIFYRDIGDYLKREEKLDIIVKLSSIDGITDWRLITPNDKHDWINQRQDNGFDSLIPLGDKDDKQNGRQTVFEPVYSRGIETDRDAWAYGSSLPAVKERAKDQIDYYNEQRALLAQGDIEEVAYNRCRLSWTSAVLRDVRKNKPYRLDEAQYRETLYRPFFKQHLLYYTPLIEMVYQMPQLFPVPGLANRLICVSGRGGTKGFSCLITDRIPDLHMCGACQCFPLYWYSRNEQQLGLFDDSAAMEWKRRDGVTDWMLKEVRARFNGAGSITKEDIFYYVYGLLHSPDYRSRFGADLRRSLPRIPIVERVDDFKAFAQAGRELADLHLDYERRDPPEQVAVRYVRPRRDNESEYDYYAIDDKMRFPARDQRDQRAARDTIVFNSRISVEGIPTEAYDYVVNGKSAIEWLMERYAVTVDKTSGIRNDPNLWAQEHNQPRYILNLLLSVVRVSLETQRIVAALPRLGTE